MSEWVYKLAMVADFELSGDGTQPAWQAVPWLPLARVGDGPLSYRTRAKMAASATGLYFLVDCDDRTLTCSLDQDYAALYNEDVVEIFLQPDPSQPLYLEYEISPLGYELLILVPNHGGKFHGWRPWMDGNQPAVRKATAVRGGAKAAGAAVSGWSAEVFIPFARFVGFGNCPPAAGAEWRANVYRIDYDQHARTQWAWCPATGGNFHDYANFGSLRF